MRSLLLLAALAAADGWVWPVPIHADGRKSKVSSGRELRKRSDGTEYLHRGVDIMFRRPKCGKQDLPFQSKCYEMPPNWPALAAGDGEVTFARYTKTGISVIIKHDKKTSTAYHHLSWNFVKEGDKVKAGQPIGYIWFNQDGYRLVHLHFDYIEDKTFVDPEPVMKSWPHIAAPAIPDAAGEAPAYEGSVSESDE